MSLFSIFALICLVGLFFINAYGFTIILARQHSLDQFFSSPSPALFWKIFSRNKVSEKRGLFLFYVHTSHAILLCLYFLFCSIAIAKDSYLPTLFGVHTSPLSLSLLNPLFTIATLLLIVFLFCDWIPRVWAFNAPASLERFAKKPAHLFFFFLLPACAITYWIAKSLFAQLHIFAAYSSTKEAPWDTLEKNEDPWTETDKRLVSSVLNFRSRIAREIMKPRVELFCIPDNISLHQAALMLQKEGYSRVPVYHDTVDSIVGVLFYKDVLSRYAEAATAGENRETLLSSPIKGLIKNVYYCPETKKISSLLQEFRKRKTHLAVIVDEYGGTSGLVTIEDILEEIVGEISDEYDEQENLFERLPGGGWLVDARMNLLDVEEEMGIVIPQEEDYDTLAGYIFYRVGSIPQAGLILHHDNFEIEITKSNDRMVEEVRITPITDADQASAHETDSSAKEENR
jgi:putative hemolysin